MIRSLYSLLAVLVLVTACGTPKSSPREGPGFVNGKPVHPTVKMGSPYSVNGETYVPRYEPNYSETGQASWYGPGFHGKSTANGEDFDQHDLTAAHRTLPLPSMVRVTNLDNGKTAIVRVNDRGPFAHGRILDLSKAAAQKLDMLRSGTAKVKVEYLPRETESYIAQLGSGKSPQHIRWEQENMPSQDVQLASAASAGGDVNAKAGDSGSWWPSLISDAKAEERPAGATEASRVTSSDLPPPKRGASDLPARLPPAGVSDDRPAKPLQTSVKPVAVQANEQKSYVNSAFSVLDETEAKGAGTAAAVTSKAEPPPVAAVAATPPPKQPPEKKPPAPQLAIQVGAFSSRENAEKMVMQYKKVAPVRIEGVPVEAPTIFRVRLGPFTDRYSAETVLSEVREKTAPDAQIISY